MMMKKNEKLEVRDVAVDAIESKLPRRSSPKRSGCC